MRLIMVLALLILGGLRLPDSQADVNSNSAQLLIGDNNGTNAGRYRSLKFTNGSTTNNGDGSISVTPGSSGTSYWNSTNAVDVYNTNSGNVGIGTWKPAYPLDVIGSLQSVTVGNVSSFTMTQVDTGSSNLQAEGNYFEFQVYAQNNGVWSVTPTDVNGVDNNDSNPFYWQLNWSAVSGATGYLIVLIEDDWQGDGSNNGAPAYMTSTTNTFNYDGATGVIFGNATVTPYSPALSYPAIHSSGDIIADQKLTVNGNIYSPNGNIGIGTFSPSTPIDIFGSESYGNLTIRNLSSPDNGSTNPRTNEKGDGIDLWEPGGGRISWFNQGGNYWNVIHYDASGNILTRQAMGNDGTTLYQAASNACFFVGGSHSGGGCGSDFLQLEDSGSIYLQDNGSTFLDIGGGKVYGNHNKFDGAASENLGIGTLSPTGALEIEGGNVGIGTFKTNNSGLTIMNGNVGIGTWIPIQKLDVIGTVRSTNLVKSGGTSSQFLKADGSVDSTAYGTGTVTSIIASTGLGGGTITTSGTITSNAEQTISYQPGLLSAVNATIGVYGKFAKASTVDNIIGSAVTFSCIANPTITMYECGTSTTCTSPTTIGTVTVTASGTAFSGTVSNPAITSGDYVGWAITAGTCASIDIAGTAQIHSN